MDVRIDRVNHEVENRIKITYYDDGFEEKVILVDEEYDAYNRNDIGYFRNSLKQLEQSYCKQHNELLGFIEEYDTYDMWSEWVMDTIEEMLGELDGISSLAKRCCVILKAMSEKAGSESN